LPSVGWGQSVAVITSSVSPKPVMGNRVPSHRVRARVRFSREITMWGCVVSAGRENGRARHTPPCTAVLVLLTWLALGAGEGRAASSTPPGSAEVWLVEAAFREAVQLWANERFEALWELGLLASRYRLSRETFANMMRHRVVKPTCCWGQLRTVRVHLQTAEEAMVEAQIEIDVRTLGTTVVRSLLVYLRREEGVWRVALEDFLTKPEAGLPWNQLGPSWPR
jgi:hypothetical protein